MGVFLATNSFTVKAQGSGGESWNETLRLISENAIENAGEIRDIEDLAGVAVNLFLGIGIAISLIALILSGIKYMSSRGDVKAAMGAKQALTYSVVAFIVTVGAFTIMNVILGVLGVENRDDIFLGTPPPNVP